MKTHIRIIWVCCILLCGSISLHAGVLKYHQRIEAGLTVGCPTITIPPSGGCASSYVTVGPAAADAFRDYSLKDILTLGIDHNNLMYLPDSFTCQVTVLIRQWDINNHPITPNITQTLTVRYTPFTYTTYLDKAAFVFPNAYSYNDSIIAINVVSSNPSIASTTTLPVNVYLDADIELQRYYDLTPYASTPISISSTANSIDCSSTPNELLVTWATQLGAEQYDLEWTFVNDYANSDLTGTYLSSSQVGYEFTHNSTRITTTATSYPITLAYEHGYLIYRVRAVGNDIYNPSINITGVWSIASDSGRVSSIASGSQYQVVNPHENDNKNYQYNATFAEEGKKKEVVTYYDGTLRSREAVTKMNSDSNVLVGQTIYDYQGRPAVTVLPVPVQFPTCSRNKQPSIHYYPDFNLVDTLNGSAYGQRPYSRLDFDRNTTDSCTVGADSMSRFQGASNYYSPLNPRQQGFQAYVPDAHGYPFSQVQYTPDNTGRIKAQGGVGPQFQLGSGHETKYIYGQPNQLELDRMFGSEAGDATHYKKNVVIDPNGQASISYLDQEGRTIATCLAGLSGTDSSGHFLLSSLPSQAKALDTLKVDLFAANSNGHSNNNTVNVDGNAIVFNTQLSVAYNSTYKFHYYIGVDTLHAPCSNICIQCVYDLQIVVTDDCGRIVASSGAPGAANPIHKHVGNFSIRNDSVVFTTSCSA
ncbi:MAG TPA: hypothetical protein VK806_05730, partial [Bacteroidia bacterium]|nr:hypothetical protein [Bacteroidia bacterium]